MLGMNPTCVLAACAAAGLLCLVRLLRLLQLAKEGLSRVVVDDNADEQRTFSRHAHIRGWQGWESRGARPSATGCLRHDGHSVQACLPLPNFRFCLLCLLCLLCLPCTCRDELKALFKVDPSQQCDTHGAIKCRWASGWVGPQSAALWAAGGGA